MSKLYFISHNSTRPPETRLREVTAKCKTCGSLFSYMRNVNKGAPKEYCQVCRPYSNQSADLREKTLERFNNTCQKCGRSDGKLVVHHIDFNECNNSKENLVLLCGSCHANIASFFAEKAKKEGVLFEWFSEWLRK